LQSSKQNGKGLKSCFAWNYKATTKQKHKGNLLHLQSSKQNGKGLKSCFAWNYKPTTKQTHKGNLLHLQTGQTLKE